MAKERSGNNFMQNGTDGIINGISTASFLQMLEQDRHSCKIKVQSKGRLGILYFDDGNLIDAEHKQICGAEAAFTIISWNSPSIAMSECAARPRIINHPLGYILLNSAKQKDESDELSEQTETTIQATAPLPPNAAEESNSLQTTITILSDIAGIRYFYILNRAGKIVFHSAPDTSLGKLMVYCIITSSNLRKTLNVKSPRGIHMQMKDGSSLLIIPKSGKILGMILDANSSAAEVTSRITTAFSVT